MFSGARFKTNGYGMLTVVKYTSKYNVTVRFDETNAELTAQSSHIRSGTVKDKFKPIVFGVGFIGDGDHHIPRATKRESPYVLWRNMLRRCYDEKFHVIQPTYRDVSVCEEWHNYQNFADWCIRNKPKTEGDWQLDKDIKSTGDKIYSPKTCTFVLRKDNMAASLAKYYSFTSPNGGHVDVYNLSDFCKLNGLNASHMSAVFNGRLRQHKGWVAS